MPGLHIGSSQSESRPESSSSDVSLILTRVLENTSPNLLQYLESSSPRSFRLTPSPSVSRPASASSASARNALTISAKHPGSSPSPASRPGSTSSTRSSPAPELQRGSPSVDINGESFF